MYIPIFGEVDGVAADRRGQATDLGHEVVVHLLVSGKLIVALRLHHSLSTEQTQLQLHRVTRIRTQSTPTVKKLNRPFTDAN